MSIQKIRLQLEQKKGQRQYLLQEIGRQEKELAIIDKELSYSNEALLILQHVAKQTQEQLQFYITDLVSLALAAVFDDPYEFELEFVTRRNKTEADFHFKKRGEKFHPSTASGGGPVDVAAFALRTSLLSLRSNKLRNVLILDEPFRFLSKDLQPKASRMLKEISDKLGLQIIMISHNKELIGGADKVFQVSIRKDKTTAE